MIFQSVVISSSSEPTAKTLDEIIADTPDDRSTVKKTRKKKKSGKKHLTFMTKAHANGPQLVESTTEEETDSDPASESDGNTEPLEEDDVVTGESIPFSCTRSLEQRAVQYKESLLKQKVKSLFLFCLTFT